MKTKLEVNQHVDSNAWTVRVMLEIGKDTVVLTSGTDADIKVAASWCLRNFDEAVKSTEKLLRNFGAEDTSEMLERLRLASPATFGAPSLRARVIDCQTVKCHERGMCSNPSACTSPSWLAFETNRKTKKGNA